MSKGNLLVISGFSGVGKGTVVQKLVNESEQYALSVSVTTRAPRPGDIDGVTYHFRTEEQFDKLVKEDYFLEYARYVGKSYGTPKAFVLDHIAEGKDVILEIEVQGAKRIKEIYPEAKLIFIVPPDAQTLKQRLTGRESETKEEIIKRLSRAVEEAESMKDYEYIIVNDDLDQCCFDIRHLLSNPALKLENQLERVQELKEEIQIFKQI